MFKIEAKGYNKTEVENKLAELEKTIDKLFRTCQEKDTVNIKLAIAVEKAKQIESSSNNLISLKFKKFMVIYKNFEQSFASLFYNYPQLSNISAIRDIIIQFKNEVSSIMENDFYSDSINSFVSTENDTIRLLLNKMSNYAKNRPSAVDYVKSDKIKRKDLEQDELHKTELVEKAKPYEKSTQIKPISNLTLKKDESYETIADKFLENEDDNSGGAYEKIIAKIKNNFPMPNESGFDLKEAVNPKEDLFTIMKSFDFK